MNATHLRRAAFRAGLVVAVGLVAGTAIARNTGANAGNTGAFAGTVRNADGEPLHGVAVRLTHDASGVSESVFTDSAGEFHVVVQRDGKLRMRLRTPYYRDIEVDVEGPDAKMAFVMEAMADELEISNSLPAGYHFGSLPFETGEDALFNRHQFQRDCLTCHQMGNPITRFPRTPEGWVETIRRMHAYLGNFDAELRDRRSVLLSKGFDGKPLAVRPEFPVDESLARTRIIEYRMERGIVPHDAIINPHDGLIYTVDQGADHMAVTDPATGQTEYVSQSGGGMIYHKFGAVAGEIAVFNGRNGPHSLALGPDRKYYVTNTSTNSIGVFNPATRKWEPSFKIENAPGQRRASYPQHHPLRPGRHRLVHAGRVRAGGESRPRNRRDQARRSAQGQARRHSREARRPMASTSTRTPAWSGTAGCSATRSAASDPATLAVTEYDSPVRGPRRMRFDADGILWVTGYSDGDLLPGRPRTGSSPRSTPCPSSRRGSARRRTRSAYIPTPGTSGSTRT